MPELKAGKSKVKLSNEQLAQLGIDPEDPEELGCGKNACAYATNDPDKVVKFTHDTLDAMTSYVLFNNPARWAIPVYGVYELPKPKNVYVIVAARAEELPASWKKAIDAIYKKTKKLDLQPEEWDDFVEEVSNGGLSDALDVIDEAVTGFRKLGLDWADFHSGNWGMYMGRPVVIDLGLTSAYERPPVKMLNEMGMREI